MNINNKPLVIPIFIPHSGCPHQCAFCNQSIITEKSENRGRPERKDDPQKRALLPSKEQIRREVDQFLAYKGSRTEVQLAFFGGNFLGLDKNEISLLLSIAQELVDDNKIDSIRFSTRPDTITQESLELISPYPVSTIELGVQSMSDKVLKKAQRGHTEADTVRAASLLTEYKKNQLKKRDKCSGHEHGSVIMRTEEPGQQLNTGQKQLQTGMQMMVGLPEDNHETAIETANKIVSLQPDFVRIYPLLVLEDSLIARWYREKKYRPMDLDSCVELVKEIFLLFERQGIPVIRMGLQASDLLEDKLSMLAGPWHPAFGHLVYSEIFFDKAVDLINKEIKTDKDITQIIFNVNPSSLSRLKGDKKKNIKRLEKIYPSIGFEIIPDDGLDLNELKILQSVTNSKSI